MGLLLHNTNKIILVVSRLNQITVLYSIKTPAHVVLTENSIIAFQLCHKLPLRKYTDLQVEEQKLAKREL